MDFFLGHSGPISFVKIMCKLQAFQVTFLCPWLFQQALRTSYPCPERFMEKPARFGQSVFPNDWSWAPVSFASTPGNLLLIKDENLRNDLKFLAHVKPKSRMKRKPFPVAVCKFAMMPNKLSFALLPASTQGFCLCGLKTPRRAITATVWEL